MLKLNPSNISNAIIKPITSFTTIAFFFLLISNTAYASEKIIAIDPPLTRIEIEPSQEITAPVTVSNASDTPISFRIELLPFTSSQHESGEISYHPKRTTTTNTSFGFLENVQVLSEGNEIESLTLGPHQKKLIELHISAPERITPSDYYFSIVFISDGSSGDEVADTDTYSQINTGVASHILLTVGPKKKAQAFIEEFSSQSLFMDRQAEFKLRIKNAGTHLVQPKGAIYIKNMFGQTVGKIDLASPFILSNTIRSIQDNRSYTDGKSANPKQPLVWSERFLLGPYTATVLVQMEPHAHTFSQTIYFIGLPARLLTTLIVTLIGIVFLLYRIQKFVLK